MKPCASETKNRRLPEMKRDAENAAGTSGLPAEFGAPHIHARGEFLHVSSGINEVSLGGTRFLAPPNSALWIPAVIPHVQLERT